MSLLDLMCLICNTDYICSEYSEFVKREENSPSWSKFKIQQYNLINLCISFPIEKANSLEVYTIENLKKTINDSICVFLKRNVSIKEDCLSVPDTFDKLYGLEVNESITIKLIKK